MRGGGLSRLCPSRTTEEEEKKTGRAGTFAHPRTVSSSLVSDEPRVVWNEVSRRRRRALELGFGTSAEEGENPEPLGCTGRGRLARRPI
mmetsp:Transcript_18172/g.41575  ORF Transcript_18172/g.41575 Transcript_18172/m.41575 type:complete len:89 (-) Transcript_18172:80-346(-)